MKYYNYKSTVLNTLLPISVSKYVADRGGSPCWVYSSEKAVYAVSLDGLRVNSNTDLMLFIEYYDSVTGYLRIEYDDDDVLTDNTIAVLESSDTWKSIQYPFTAKLNNILSDGDFQIFAADAEDTTSDLELVVKKIGVLRTDTNAIATWETIGLEPVNRYDFTEPIKSDPREILENSNPVIDTIFYQGQLCQGHSNGTTNPLFYSLHETGSSLYWRDNSTKDVEYTIEYFDEGTDDIVLSYKDGTSEYNRTLVTKTDSGKWLTKTYRLGTPGGVLADVYIMSNTTNSSDPIIDSSENNYPVNITAGVTEHRTTDPAVGLSSIYTDGTGEVTITADVGTFNVGSNPLTVMFWLKFTNTGGNEPRLETVGGWGFTMFDGFFRFRGFDSAQQTAQSLTPGDGNWHHITMCYDGSNVAVWRDGGVNKIFESSVSTLDPGGNIFQVHHGASDEFDFDELYIKTGTALYTPTDVSVPYPPSPAMILDDPVKNPIIDPIKFDTLYPTENADFKLSTSSSGPLYISRIDLMSLENNALALWRPLQ